MLLEALVALGGIAVKMAGLGDVIKTQTAAAAKTLEALPDPVPRDRFTSCLNIRFALHLSCQTAVRHPGCDIALDDVAVSPPHAQFRCVTGEFRVIDVGNLNGVTSTVNPWTQLCWPIATRCRSASLDWCS